MKRLSRAGLVTTFLLVSICTPVVVASAQGRPEPSKAAPGAGPRLHLSTKSTTYRIGELIPLELSFSSATPKRYQINMARYDRSGRMNYEGFVVSPKEGTRDPLSLYFNSIPAFVMGGLTGFKFLSSNPTVIELNLNEWASFDKPGTYKVKVVSGRVSDAQGDGNPVSRAFELESNTIELRIVPSDAAWQQAQLAQAVAVLDRGTRNEVYAAHDPYWHALSVLRYLGSEAAARELARRLRGENNNTDFQCMFGLIGSPNRQIGFTEMDRLFDDPEFPISGLFLTTMSILPLDPSESSKSLNDEREANMSVLRQRLATSVADKQGKALAVSLDTLLGDSGSRLSAENRSRLVPQLVQVFPLLSASEQAAWLQDRWDDIRSPAWVPVLRKIALRYHDFSELREEHAYESLQVSSAALVRWYELDPTDARDAVIAEITRPKPRYSARVLGILPDKTLPEAGQVIAQNLLDTDNFEIEGNLASLLFRYADASDLPEVLSKADSLVGTWACEPQDDTLAYILKVDPATARPLIERAIEARGPGDNACRHMLFTDIGALQPSPILEDLALRALDDPDPEVVMNAADYLGAHGSAAAEQALWVRYEQWSQEWNGRDSELRFVPGAGNSNVWSANLGESLARALATGVGWLADPLELRRIQDMAVGANIRQQISQDLQSWSQRPLSINYIPSVPANFLIAQYNLRSLEALKTKLAEFPRGTKFFLPEPEPGASEEELAALQEIVDIAAKAGLVITRVPEPSQP